ncbi:MAG TPA: glycosyltransferase family 39 protein, partial [Kouleothrix sp.]|nr:glycosyltransferase family 39 protein [Kouleothrix sp.]
MSLSSLPPRTAWRAHSGLGLALALGLALRLALWGHLPRTGWISDEGEYFSAASWLAAGRNFGWYLGYLWTRAPLYPLFVAAHLRLFGETPTPVFASQMVLSLLNVVLVYALTRHLIPANRQAATLAAVLMALYFPFAVYPQALLSETLFIALLLGAFLALAYAVAIDDRRPLTARLLAGQRSGQVRWLVLAGGLMGFATLTRSITLAFLPVVALWLLAQ